MPRRLGLALLVGALVLTGCSDDPEQPAEITYPDPPATAPAAPPFEVELLDGSTLDVTEVWAETPVVVYFFETDCDDCPDQHAALEEVAAERPDELQYLSVAGTSDPEDVTDYVEEHGITHPVATDPGYVVWDYYGAAGKPLLVLISKGGSLLRGWPEGTETTTLLEAIDELAVDRTGA